MEVDAPSAILTYALAHLLAKLVHTLDVVEPVDYRAGGVSGNAIGAEAGVHARLRYFLRCPSSRVAGGVALDILAGLTAEQLIDRHSQSLALQVPERDVERAQCMRFFAPGGIEVGAEHRLP